VKSSLWHENIYENLKKESLKSFQVSYFLLKAKDLKYFGWKRNLPAAELLFEADSDADGLR